MTKDLEGSRILGNVKVDVLKRGRFGTHWLSQVRDYVAASGPLGVQLVPGIDKAVFGKLGVAKGDEEDIRTFGRLEKHQQILKNPAYGRH